MACLYARIYAIGNFKFHMFIWWWLVTLPLEFSFRQPIIEDFAAETWLAETFDIHYVVGLKPLRWSIFSGSVPLQDYYQIQPTFSCGSKEELTFDCLQGNFKCHSKLPTNFIKEENATLIGNFIRLVGLTLKWLWVLLI